ncbi:hypothetical protein ACFQ07_15670, partial [Actinomadura adrarensis]
ASTPAVDLRPRLARSVPPGQCPQDPPQKLTPKSPDVARWIGDGVSGDFSRAHNNAIPAELHGRWRARRPDGLNQEFVFSGGAVGTEAVRSRLLGPNHEFGCESMHVLVSADDPIITMPIRFTRPAPECGLGPMQGFQLVGEDFIWEWDDVETGRRIYLKRA